MQTYAKDPTSIRIVQLILGGIAIALSLAVIVNPGFGFGVLIFLLSATLLVVGSERVSIGFSKVLPKSARIGNLALGGLAIATGIAVLVFPVFTTGLLVTLLSVGLLFVGIAIIIHGITAKNTSKWSRVFSLGVGILSVAIAAMVISTPLLGVFLLTFILAINLLIIGIESITYALAGRGFKTNATAYMKNSK